MRISYLSHSCYESSSSYLGFTMNITILQIIQTLHTELIRNYHFAPYMLFQNNTYEEVSVCRKTEFMPYFEVSIH
jgi:hypothetical protein